MKATKRVKHRIILLICLMCVCGQARTQQNGPEERSDPGEEYYRIVSDRTLYIAGENISFRVFNLGSEILKMINWGKVLYMELISPGGLAFSQVKFPLDSSGSSGQIRIPEDLPSGSYYLKGYTRWMRNYGPASYAYLSVEIVNPYTRSLLPVDTSSQFNLSLTEKQSNSWPDKWLSYELAGDTDTESEIRLYLRSDLTDRPLDFSVSVIPEVAGKAQRESGAGTLAWDLILMDQLPETRGVSLAGKVEFEGSGLAAPFAVVYLSMIDQNRDFYCNYADSAGSFHFAFPDKYGEANLFVSADHKEGKGLALFIDKDFCTEPVLLPSYPLDIVPSSLPQISGMSENAQISAQFYPVQEQADHITPPGQFFYGQPSIVIHFDDFIKLPTMEEYFTEVTPQVSLRKSGRRKRFRVLGEHPDLDIYPPLVMIDGVAITDTESLLAISPRSIDRMEIVDAPYIRGNITFGGIINIISRNDDLGLIDLPESGLLVNYTMFDRSVQEDQQWQSPGSKLPDVRNTLFWTPSVKLGQGKDTTIRFHTSDNNGDFRVLIQGYGPEGEYFQEVIPFTVE